jgi:cytochrome c553
MRNRSWVWILAVVAISLFVAGGLYAGNKFEDKVKLQDPSYPHTKGAVEFSHALHVDKYKATCGECHHDDKGKPLAALKKGDDVKKCVECHKKPAQPKAEDAKNLSKEQKREYHAMAMHDNCIGCHKEYNKKNNTKNAPEVCNKCHPKAAGDK